MSKQISALEDELGTELTAPPRTDEGIGFGLHSLGERGPPLSAAS